MNSVRTLALITLLTIVGSLVVLTVNARYHGDNIGGVRHRHRHHHEVSSLTTRRNHEPYKIATRKPTWNANNDDDYVDDAFGVADEDNKKKNGGGGDDDEENDENYYRIPRNYPSKYEIRYRDTRYHVNPPRHGINPWQNIDDVEQQQQRRRNLRFTARGHRTRPWIYPPRNHDSMDIEDENDDISDDDMEDYDEYERSRWHHLQDEDYDESLHRRSFPLHRRYDYSHNSPSYRGWIEPKRDGKLRRSDQDIRRKLVYYRSGDGRKRFSSNNFYNIREFEKNDDKNISASWFKNKLRKLNDTVISVDDEEENIWKEADFDGDGDVDDDDEDEDDEEDDDDDGDGDGDNDNDNDMIDNDFFHETEPPYKTFDDIIRSLTSDDPTTSKPLNIKRDYRNIEIEKYLKRDAYGNLKYVPKKLHKSIISITKSPSIIKTKYSISNTNGKQKLSNGIAIIDNRKIDENKINNIRMPVYQMKKMNLMHHNDDDNVDNNGDNVDDDDDDEDNDNGDDEYLNSDDKHSDIQADVTNGYTVDESDENETSAPVTRGITTPITSTSIPTSTSISTSTTTTTTTTTPRPVITTTKPNYDRKDSRPYDGTSNTSLQNNNGLQTIHNSPKSQIKNPVVQPAKNGKSAEIREALQHAMKVSREGSCQWPRARVIPVRDVYPSPSSTYIPHCAILHRCSDDTGCCRSEALTCVPKQTHKVELYFYTTSIGGGSVVEKLSFYNHTECECREKREYGMATTATTTTSDNKLFSMQDSNEYKSYAGRQQHQSAVPPQNIRRQPQKKPCRCPSEFTPRIVIGGECQCNCFENDENCVRIRRGKGYFSLRDRLCIQNNECAMPACEFGDYMKRQGKCPRKKDKFDAIAKYPSNINHNHKYRS